MEEVVQQQSTFTLFSGFPYSCRWKARSKFLPYHGLGNAKLATWSFFYF